MTQGFLLMAFGMGTMFLVLAILYLTIKLLNKFFAPKHHEEEKQ